MLARFSKKENIMSSVIETFKRSIEQMVSNRSELTNQRDALNAEIIRP
jgi:hypothetical protein